MMEFIFDLFPQSRGEQVPSRTNRSFFETLFRQEDPSTPAFPRFNWFDRVHQSLTDADERLVHHIDSGRQDRFLLPRKKNIYAVSGNPSSGEAVPLNESVSDLIPNKTANSRHVSISLIETSALETLFRSQSESLSHAMWILTGLLGYVHQEGFAPRDPALFNQMISSLSMGLAQQSNAAAAGSSFMCLKRRSLYLSHLPPHFPGDSRKDF